MSPECEARWETSADGATVAGLGSGTLAARRGRDADGVPVELLGDYLPLLADAATYDQRRQMASECLH
ncbi:hypothetical protein Aca07nite_86980 [Actinoplanes capillaceus]|uniref:Uncharacterized protein n=1 Tax=Actinoplanes campanulatus TaxID=113559 RepID=A0ABQ3WZ70_9ACTN|nr:hypothetical protein Aca07nite_86980 [Actinoplanes capillaceus]